MGDFESEDVKNFQQTVQSNIHQYLEENGDLNEVKCLIRKKILEFVRSDNGVGESGDHLKVTKSGTEKSSIQLLNQLIQEYFQWSCYMYSLEMLKTETSDDSGSTSRDNLEDKLKPLKTGKDFDKELPLLLQIVMESMK